MKSIVESCDWHNVGKTRLDMSVMTSSFVTNRNYDYINLDKAKINPEAYIGIWPQG